MAKERDKKADYTEAYNQAWPSFGAWQAAAKKDIAAYLGDIYTADEKQRLRLQGRDILNIQLIRRLVKWLSGFQADHRKGIKYDPIEGSDDRAASDFTDLVSYVMQRCNGYEVITKSFEHALKTGLTLVNAYNDVNSNTKLDHFFYTQFLLDPSFTRLNLSDCRYGIIRKFITKDQAKILLPEGQHGKVDKIDNERQGTDEKFPNYVTPLVHGQKMIAYDEFQERTTKEQIVIINRFDGTEQEWQGTRKQLDEQLPILLQMRGIPAESIAVINRLKETVEVSAFLNGEHFNTEIDPFGIGDFSFTPIWCYYDPEYNLFDWKLQGLVRSLREIQRAESKRILSMISWYENSIANGLDFEEGSLVDLEDAYATGTKPRMFKEGALAGNRARDRQVPAFPGGNLELHQILEDSMTKTIGLNPDMLGEQPQSTKNLISGVLSQIRIGAGMVGTRTLFDDLSTSQNIIGGKILKLMQQYPYEKVVRILGRQPAESFSSKDFGTFDTVVSEAPITDTQRNTRYQELMNIKRSGAEMGDPAPVSWGDLIELAPIEMNTELLEKMQKQEQAAMEQSQRQIQQQNQLQDMTIAALDSTIQMQNAAAMESRADAIKSLTAAELNEAKSSGVPIDIQMKNQAQTLKTISDLGRLSIEQQKMNQPPQKAGE